MIRRSNIGYTNALLFGYNSSSLRAEYDIEVTSNKSFSCMNCNIKNIIEKLVVSLSI